MKVCGFDFGLPLGTYTYCYLEMKVSLNLRHENCHTANIIQEVTYANCKFTSHTLTSVVLMEYNNPGCKQNVKSDIDDIASLGFRERKDRY